MTARFCRICSAPALEGSTLCAEHRAQAALFARAVAADQPRAGSRQQRVEWAERDAFASEIKAAFERVLARAKETQGPAHRFPEIAVYVLNGKLRARPYYTVLTPGSKKGGYELGSALISRELAPGGVLFETLAREVVSRREELEKGTVRTVSLELQGHTGLALVSERRGDARREVIRLHLGTEGFVDAP